jgi:hypothetical protein
MVVDDEITRLHMRCKCRHRRLITSSHSLDRTANTPGIYSSYKQHLIATGACNFFSEDLGDSRQEAL